MSLPSGATFANGEVERIQKALAELQNDTHSPREISVKVILTFHQEYPKHIVIGKDKDDNDIVKIVNSEDEEKEALKKEGE